MKFATLIKTKKNMKNKPEPDNPLPDSGWSRIRALLDPLQLLGIKQDPVCLAEEWRKLEQVNARLMERDRRWDALYQAGGGKVSDFILADFGTLHPEGLEIQTISEQTIKFKSIVESDTFKNRSLPGKALELFRTAGMVEWTSDDTIHMNPVNFTELGRNLTAPYRFMTDQGITQVSHIAPHEFIHTRQHHREKSGWFSPLSGMDLQSIGMQDKSSLQRFWRDTVRTARDISTALDHRGRTTSGYFSDKKEMQARMHEMLAVGYAQWQKLPQNRTELWAALYNMGVEPTEEVGKWMRESEEGRKALTDFAVNPSISARVAGDASTFNNIASHVGEDDVKQGLWLCHYPSLYGELLEFYGDGPGRARMGLGHNPNAAIEALKTINSENAELSEEKALQIADSVPAHNASPFLNALISAPVQSRHYQNTLKVADAFLARADVREQLVRNDEIDGFFPQDSHQTVRNYVDTDNRPPLDKALLLGRSDMVRLLMQAGVDPFQRYIVVDIRDKPLFTSFPASIVHDVAQEQAFLADPNSAPKERREWCRSPEAHAWSKARLKAIETMLESSEDPDHASEIVYHGGSKELLSLREFLARSGIGKTQERQTVPEYEA